MTNSETEAQMLARDEDILNGPLEWLMAGGGVGGATVV